MSKSKDWRKKRPKQTKNPTRIVGVARDFVQKGSIVSVMLGDEVLHRNDQVLTDEMRKHLEKSLGLPAAVIKYPDLSETTLMVDGMPMGQWEAANKPTTAVRDIRRIMAEAFTAGRAHAQHPAQGWDAPATAKDITLGHHYVAHKIGSTR